VGFSAMSMFMGKNRAEKGAHKVMFPDLNILTPEHWDMIDKNALVPGRPFMQQLIKSICDPCHEVLHFV